jgi:tetratricopeptide (TPR) repeat protein
MGNVRAAGQEYALIRFIDHIFAINHVQYDIETAAFDADHNQNLAQALRIAQSVATVRHDVTTEDTLAWALYKNGRYSEAWSAERQALRLGTQYAPFYFHAGMIQAKLGNAVEAQSYLHSAIMLNPNFSVLYAPVARAQLIQLDRMAAAQRTARP